MVSSPPQIAIIPAGPGDLPRIEAMARIIWPEAFAGILPADRIGPMLDAIYAQPTLSADIAVRGHDYCIATVDGADAGFVSAYREGGRLWIKKLYLFRWARGLGLGKRLIATAMERHPGSTELALYVNNGNAPAIAFYRSQGFDVEAEVPVRMGPFDFTDFIMVRPL